MPDPEGLLGIVELLEKAQQSVMSDDVPEAVGYIMKAQKEAIKLAKLAIDDVQVGMELGKLLQGLKDKGI